MKKLLTIIAISAITLFSFTGCDKSIITTDPGILDDRNIELRIVNYWGGNFLSTDSIYKKNGARFKVDNVEFLISNFYYNNDGDTTYNYTDFTLTNTKSSNFKLGLIRESSVSGSLGFLIGLDSLANSTDPGDWSDGEVLANENIYSGSKIGYNFITVSGRVFDPSKPNETEPSIKMKWVVATNFYVSKKDIKRNFSVPTGKQVVVDAGLRVDLLFDDLNPGATPIIKSDPADATDYAAAMKLRDNFRYKAFIIQ